jgi:hypothetical protein
MKRLCLVLAVVLAVSGLASATDKEFSMGHFYLTPQVGFASWGGMPFGVNAEYAISENIGVGGTVMAQFWSYGWGTASWVTLAANANYHFIKLPADKLDLYAGAELGYGIYSFSYASGWDAGSTGSSGLSLAAVVGARYFFSPKIAVSVRFASPFLGSYTGFGGAVGVTFLLK